jgi:hypothetical protein
MSESFDEFGNLSAIIPHGVCLELDTLVATIGFEYDFTPALIEAADVDLTFFAVDPNFDPISRNVIAAYADLCD